MLTRAGFGDDALLSHALGEQSLAEAVVDLVRAGVQQVFALQIDLRAAQFLGEPFAQETAASDGRQNSAADRPAVA